MVHGSGRDIRNLRRRGAVKQAAAPDGREVALRTQHGHWQEALWKILSHPTLEVAATLVVVTVATWYLMQNEAAHPGVFFLIGRH